MATAGKLVTFDGVKEDSGARPGTTAVSISGVTLRKGKPTPVTDQAVLDRVESLRDLYTFTVKAATKSQLDEADPTPDEGDE